MKRIFLVLFVFTTTIGFSQHWLQPGAIYNYRRQVQADYRYDKLEYVKDTLAFGRESSMLHRQHKIGAGNFFDFGDYYLNKNNDSVFVNTGNGWRFLFNLNPQQGDIWNYGAAPTGAPAPCNTSLSQTIVDSIVNETLNGVPMRKIYVHFLSGSFYGYNGMITDRFGPAQSFIDWNEMTTCPPTGVSPFWQTLTCYADSNFYYQHPTFFSLGLPCPNYLTGLLEKNKPVAFSVFPNPAFDLLSLRFNNSVGVSGHINILNFTGKIIKSIEFENTNNLAINIEQLLSGIYFIEIITPNGKGRSKVIKQ